MVLFQMIAFKIHQLALGLQVFKMNVSNVHHPRRNVVSYDKDHSSFYLILHILHSRSVLFCLQINLSHIFFTFSWRLVFSRFYLNDIFQSSNQASDIYLRSSNGYVIELKYSVLTFPVITF